MTAEHGEEATPLPSTEHGGPRFSKNDSVDEIENDDSDSDNGEFITIRVTNEEGKIEAQAVDLIKERKEFKAR